MSLVKKSCDPWGEIIKCPLILYTILVIVGVILNLSAMSKAPSVNRNGVAITSSQKWRATVIGLGIYLVIAFLFGYWIYRLCQRCETLNSWLVFLLAIFFPLVLAVIVGMIIGGILGITTFVFGR